MVLPIIYNNPHNYEYIVLKRFQSIRPRQWLFQRVNHIMIQLPRAEKAGLIGNLKHVLKS